jgi:hypothetical protein
LTFVATATDEAQAPVIGPANAGAQALDTGVRRHHDHVTVPVDRFFRLTVRSRLGG